MHLSFGDKPGPYEIFAAGAGGMGGTRIPASLHYLNIAAAYGGAYAGG